jgi:hypothetical protein
MSAQTVTTGAIDFAIVGAQKAGSTQLGACLLDHPEICLCADEVPYFQDPFYENSQPAELERVFARRRPGQLRGIHRPDYLARPECPARIAADAPGARILVVLRDPAARAISAYFWYLQFGMLPLEPVDIGLTKLLDGWTDPRYPHAGEILEYGRYAAHLRRYHEAFGPERVFVLLSGDLGDRRTIAEVYRFLDVDPGHVASALGHRRNEGVYDLRRLRLLRSRRRLTFSWDSTDRYTYRTRRLRKPVSFLPNAAVVAVDRLVLARLFGNEKPVVPEPVTRRLREYYSEDVADLGRLLARDLSSWG